MDAEKQTPSRYQGRRSRTVPASFLDSEEATPVRASATSNSAAERQKTPRRAQIPTSLLDEEERSRSYGQRAPVTTSRSTSANNGSATTATGRSRSRSLSASADQQQQQYHHITSSRQPPPLPANVQPVPFAPAPGTVQKAAPEETSGGLSRSRSRYRRAPNPASVEPSPPPPPPAIPPMPSMSSSVPPKQAPFDISKLQIALAEEARRVPPPARRQESAARDIYSSGSASSSDSKEAANYVPEPVHRPLNRSNTVAQPRCRELSIRLGNKTVTKLKTQPGATVGNVLDQACEWPPKTLRGAAVLVERLGDIPVERGLHEAELVSNIVDGWENNQQDKELYLVVDIARSALLRPLSSKDSVEPPYLSEYFYYGCGTDAKFNRSKRHVSLEDGKLVISKKEHEKEKSRGIIAKLDLLHFGVYTAQDPSKNYLLDAPRKYVIVIKSLEKASQFLDKSRYIHYLSTKDAELYKKWVDGLSKARNCFLEKRDRSFSGKAKNAAASRDGGQNAPVAPLVNGAGNRASIDFDSRNKSRPTTASRRAQESGPLLRDDGPEEFLSSGLLGKMYEKKKEEQMIREKHEQSNHVFSPGDEHMYNADSLLARYKTNNSSMHDKSRRTSMDSSRRASMDMENAPLQRSKSTRSVKGRMPQPLLSFDEEAPPPLPQNKLRGRGYTVDKADGPLIQHATQPSAHIFDPKSPPSSGRQRGLSLSAGKYHSGAELLQSPEEVLFPSPFQASSLLASLPDAKPAAQHRGHGIATGKRSATQPLMDMSVQSQFVPGSLLAMNERLIDGGPTYKKTNICREDD